MNARVVSGVELAGGIAIVVGHNVFHVVPNEVLILVPLGLLSIRLRDGGFAAIGLVRPASWRRLIAIAVAAAVLRIALGEVVEPLAARIWGAARPPEGIDEITGNVSAAALTLGLVWTFAAFGEEIAYRGYLLTRAADLGAQSTRAQWIAMVAIAALFGVGHHYKGIAGMIDSGVAGVILGAAYLVAGRNLWASILAHGLIDTVALAVVFLGWDW